MFETVAPIPHAFMSLLLTQPTHPKYVGNFVGTILTSGRIRFLISGLQNGACHELSTLCFPISATVTDIVPPASKIPMPMAIAVFDLIHVIIFSVPFTRVKVEMEAAAPLAIATAVTDFASATGAA